MESVERISRAGLWSYSLAGIAMESAEHAHADEDGDGDDHYDGDDGVSDEYGQVRVLVMMVKGE